MMYYHYGFSFYTRIILPNDYKNKLNESLKSVLFQDSKMYPTTIAYSKKQKR